MIIYEPPKAATHIPIVDFADAFSPDLEARRKVAEEVHKACRDTGFFYIVNHGAPDAMMRPDLIAEVFDVDTSIVTDPIYRRPICVPHRRQSR